MEKSSRFVELCNYLQDPHLVARFQHMCGVRGTFSRTVSGSGSGGREADRSHAHNNGACHRHIAGEGTESDNSVGIGGGEGDMATHASSGARKRSAKKPPQGEESENASQNGAAVSEATAGGDATAARDSAGSNCRTESEEKVCKEERKGEEAPKHSPCSTTLKPLRKNSLTGDAGQEFLIENRFFFYLFTFGTELGNELFYITFFPFVTWNIDAFVSRRLVMVWVWVMYLGQCTKDVIGWSRPASPPVVKVEMFYNSEYSMPSTHAMSGTAIPFSLFFMTYGRFEYPFSLGFSLALCWCLVVCVSRIYMGMHSVLDVIAGVLYSSLILFFFLPMLDTIDGFNLTCRYAPLIIVSFHLGLGLFSFTLDTWSTSRGDTAQILGVGAGVALASHGNHLLGLMPDPTPEQFPLTMPDLSAGLVGAAVLRLFVGVLVLMSTRALMKAVTIPLVCRVFGVPCDDVRKARQHMEVELSYRYIVYGSVGFSMLFLVPLLFDYMHLS